MKFRKVALGEILLELEELPSTWMDETARELVESIDETLQLVGNKKPSLEELAVNE